MSGSRREKKGKITGNKRRTGRVWKRKKVVGESRQEKGIGMR